MSNLAIQQSLITFIDDEVLEGQGQGITADTELLELGILDSLTLVSLTAFISQEHGIEIPDEYITPDHFGSIKVITNLIEELRCG